MLKVMERNIVDEEGKAFILRGMNLGNWMLTEPNMFGTVGTERRLRRAMEECAGTDKTKYFFDCLLDKWITEKDISYLKSLGINSLRVPLNYRYFEKDETPFNYEKEGFARLDKLVELCRKYKIYLILDMHAAQGCQSGDWHCNNIFQEQTEFYYDRTSQNRFVELWKQIAKRYCGEKWVAGYDLLNEPVALTEKEMDTLNRIYIRTIREIRKIDTEHLIFLEGNQWSQEFEKLEHKDFGENIVYSPHYYCEAAVQEWAYPGEHGGIQYNRAAMELEMDKRDQWIRERNAPCWIGEFGVRRLGSLAGKRQALKDYISVFEERGHSWCYWNFKDLKVRGLLFMDEESPWRKFTDDFEQLKLKYHTDRSLPIEEGLDIDFILRDFQKGDFKEDKDYIRELLIRNIRETLGDQLTWTFAEKFSALSFSDIDWLTDSFLFENCKRDEAWENIIKMI